jgi:hypothetical protein
MSIVVFWIVTLFSLAGGNLIQKYIASQPRRPQSTVKKVNSGITICILTSRKPMIQFGEKYYTMFPLNSVYQ